MIQQMSPGIGHDDAALENYRRFIVFQPNETPASFNYEMGNII
ncbi:MAG: hypothetical protein WDM78_16005 [Puia sp.]